MNYPKFGGIVLCGGQSRRMGQPKAWLPFGDELMLQRVARLVGEAVDPVIVVAAPKQELPPLPNDVRIVRDKVEGCGPLGGLAAGVHALRDSVDAAYLSGCDVPLLHPAFVRRICALLDDHMICVPKVGGRLHPLAAVYRVETENSVNELLAESRLRPVFLFDKVMTRVVTEEELSDVDAEFRSLQNLNTPREYEAALRQHN